MQLNSIWATTAVLLSTFVTMFSVQPVGTMMNNMNNENQILIKPEGLPSPLPHNEIPNIIDTQESPESQVLQFIKSGVSTLGEGAKDAVVYTATKSTEVVKTSYNFVANKTSTLIGSLKTWWSETKIVTPKVDNLDDIPKPNEQVKEDEVIGTIENETAEFIDDHQMPDDHLEIQVDDHHDVPVEIPHTHIEEPIPITIPTPQEKEEEVIQEIPQEKPQDVKPSITHEENQLVPTIVKVLHDLWNDISKFAVYVLRSIARFILYVYKNVRHVFVDEYNTWLQHTVNALDEKYQVKEYQGDVDDFLKRTGLYSIVETYGSAMVSLGVALIFSLAVFLFCFAWKMI
ncbi:hypothetical protein EIN_173470 [Entamoeba invadens IP1]|uniref:Uncharacterized protein n=1 Tax=Entamoeba invadens IP1 TaxID=370355 RepID=A0A0A1TVZ5_ENTIV|nr:hypothetical protein EIN_173470 [Entamoeba invadens IP1]ELP84672.1 hypothetical protein EIN_173470 [Entamoeba invadens IP1]|eukprot:XP_004184018.1 hypothetical protein EIN_173470 [Entamoeba invadens IP1]